MAQNASKMLDKRAYINLFVLIGYSGLYNFYLYQLFYGSWYPVHTKGFYYLITIITLLWGIIDRKMVKNSTETSRHIGYITEIIVILNFVFIVITLYDIIFTPLLNFFIYNGSVLITTLIVLVIGTKHEIFKK